MYLLHIIFFRTASNIHIYIWYVCSFPSDFLSSICVYSIQYLYKNDIPMYVYIHVCRSIYSLKAKDSVSMCIFMQIGSYPHVHYMSLSPYISILSYLSLSHVVFLPILCMHTHFDYSSRI